MRGARLLGFPLQIIALATLASLAASCQQPAPDLREWTAADHKNTSNTGAEKKGQTTGTEPARTDGLDEVSITTWQTKCVSCHGRVGQGDGPQAMVFKPRDLTDPEWQASVTDEMVLASIQKGKNKMPAFALPEVTAHNLVRLVRRLGELRRPAAGASAGSAAPPASTAPATTAAGVAAPATTAAGVAAPATTAAGVAAPATTGPKPTAKP